LLTKIGFGCPLCVRLSARFAVVLDGTGKERLLLTLAVDYLRQHGIVRET